VPYRGYAESGYEVPAALVPVRGTPAYARATAGLPVDLASKVVFVCTLEHLERYNFHTDVQLRFPHISTAVVPISEASCGPGGALRAAAEYFRDTDSVIVHPASMLIRTALAARLSVIGELGGLVGVVDGIVDGTGGWAAEHFVTVDRIGQVNNVDERWSESAMALTGTMAFDGHSGTTAEALSVAFELEPTTGPADYLRSMIKRRVPLGVDRVSVAWDLTHAAGLGAYLAHR
jgi:hypothetical protein